MQLWLAFLLTIAVSSSSGLVPGGLSDERKPGVKDDPAVEIVPKVASEIRTQIAAKLVTGDSGNVSAIKDAPIVVLAYKTQVVAGANYFVKAKIDKYIFLLRIYEPLKGEPSLSAVKGPVKETDPIEYFS